MRNLNLTTEDFKQHFRVQLKLLRQDYVMMQGGDYDFAPRAATTIRTLFHQTRNCTSLLTHLGATNVNIVSEVGIVPWPALIAYIGYGPNRHSESPRHMIIGHLPAAGPHAVGAPTGKRPRSAAEWWNEVIFYRKDRDKPFSMTRKQLVLGAADKDGGAHVDSRLDPTYHEFANTSVQALVKNREGVVTGMVPYDRIEGITIWHLVADLLESPDFLALGD